MNNNRDPLGGTHPQAEPREGEVAVPEGGLLVGKVLLPVNDRILVLRDVAPDRIGKIVVPEKGKEVPDAGVIVALPDAILDEFGEGKASNFKIGQQVMFGKYAGWDLEFDGKLHTLLRAEEIFGVLVDKKGGEGQSTESAKCTPTRT